MAPVVFPPGLGRAHNQATIGPASRFSGAAAPLLDKGTRAVQKLCKPIRGLPQGA